MVPPLRRSVLQTVEGRRDRRKHLQTRSPDARRRWRLLRSASMAEPTTTPTAKRRSRKSSAKANDAPAAPSATDAEQPRGRTPPLDEATAEELFRRGVALFNGVRYWHAHEAWET